MYLNHTALLSHKKEFSYLKRNSCSLHAAHKQLVPHVYLANYAFDSPPNTKDFPSFNYRTRASSGPTVNLLLSPKAKLIFVDCLQTCLEFGPDMTELCLAFINIINISQNISLFTYLEQFRFSCLKNAKHCPDLVALDLVKKIIELGHPSFPMF